MDVKDRLAEGNAHFRAHGDAERRRDTAANGQHPYAIVICCSDSRVIPEEIFHAGIGDLFVIRLAGNVIGPHVLGSVEYAAAHLHCKQIALLGHTKCGAIGAALQGEAEGWMESLVSEIRLAIDSESDPIRACERNVRFGVQRLIGAFAEHPEMQDVQIDGAIYDVATGAVRWL